MIKLIHIIVATTGEYSDRMTSIVGAFEDQAWAIDYATQRNREIAEYAVKANAWYGAASKLRHLRVEEWTERLGPPPEKPDPYADDYTVISVPIGEIGDWEIR